MKLMNVAMILGGTLLLGACESLPDVNETMSDIPQWILNPEVEDAIAASDCVTYSGNISLDQRMATANARLTLAQQIETRVESLDKTYASRTDADGDTATGNTFSSVSKQITQQTLNGSRVVKSDIVKITGKEHYCVMVALSPTVTKDLFSALIKNSKRPVTAQDEKFLYQEFKAYKAEQDLSKEIERLSR